MSENNQIIHWIMIGIQQELNDPSELFYYDKKEKQFFSILHIDYLLFDQNLNIIEDISMYYTKEELNILRKRIKKIRKKDSSIQELPRFGIMDSEIKIKAEITKFIEENSIEIDKVTLFETFQKEPIYPIKKKKVKTKTKTWWKFW